MFIASPADILRRASRVPSLLRGEGTRDARLRMSAGEAIMFTDIGQVDFFGCQK